MKLSDNCCEKSEFRDADRIKAGLLNLREKEDSKLPDLDQAGEREKQVFWARRAEINNLLCSVGMAAELNKRGSERDSALPDLLSSVNATLEQMLADREFAGGHQFTLDESESGPAE